MNEVVALRHVPFEDLGRFAPLLIARDMTIRYVDTPVDDLAAVDAMVPDLVVVLGGPIGAYQDAEYPFLVDELRLIERRLRAGKPILGLCLGAQLMARALGARVYPGAVKEIGWAPLTLTPEGGATPLRHLDGGATAVLHWHGDSFDLPEGARRLASTGNYENQAFDWGEAALGLQFHAEAAGPELERWFVGHAVEIAAAPDIDVPRLRADTQRWSTVIEERGARFLEDWLSAAGL